MLWDENKIFFFHRYFETKNYVYFGYAQGYYNGNGVLLDLQAKSAIKTIFFNDLVFVQGTKILPIMQYAFSTLDGVYEWLNPQLIDDGDFFENIKNSYLSPDLDKLEELRKLTENSNPVIFYYSND